ncbi:hypothetical protein [Nisaea sp.]
MAVQVAKTLNLQSEEEVRDGHARTLLTRAAVKTELGAVFGLRWL